ncbi:MAG: methyltransferase domain-containing protein [Candidatus Omnitrophota bacterium]|nr:methyltransferase domain-containing protein [Candidatus Omnitrophota bacterium]
MTVDQKDSVKKYFSDTSEDYNAAYDANRQTLRSYVFSLRKQHVFNLINLKAGGRVLDVGCGPGVFAEELLKSGYEVWGIDISEEMVKLAERKMQEKGIRGIFHFNTGDIESIDFPDKYFDFVLCVGVLEYLKEDSRALNEVRRVLKDGGKAIFTVPNIASPFSLLERLSVIILKFIFRILKVCGINVKKPQESLLFRSDLHDRYYLPWRFNRKLLKSGLKIEQGIFHLYRIAFMNAVSPSLTLFFTRKLEFLSKTPFYWMGINYIVMVSKD